MEWFKGNSETEGDSHERAASTSEYGTLVLSIMHRSCIGLCKYACETDLYDMTSQRSEHST